MPRTSATRRTPSGDIPVSLGERWYILGAPGGGKTRFAKRLAAVLRGLYPYAHLYVIDSKGEPEFARWPGFVTSEDAPEPLRRRKDGRGGVQVWSPPEDNPDEYGRFMDGILKARQPAVVLIDELSSLGGNTPSSFPVGLARLQKQGRGLNIGAIILSQEGAYIPRQVARIANHFVYFGLGPEDTHGRGQAARMLGLPEPREPAQRYGFLYRRLLPAPGRMFEYGDYSELLGAA